MRDKHFVSQNTAFLLEALVCCHARELQANKCAPADFRDEDPESWTRVGNQVALERNKCGSNKCELHYKIAV